MFPSSSLFNVHASEPYVTIGQTSDFMSRAFRPLLIVLDFQMGTSSPILFLAIASLDLTSSSHVASELNIEPRYLNDLVSARGTPATVTLNGVYKFV